MLCTPARGTDLLPALNGTRSGKASMPEIIIVGAMMPARIPPRRQGTLQLSGSGRMAQARIVSGIHILKTKRSDRCYLRDVLAGFCPVEVGRVAGEDDHASRRKCLHPVTVEGFAQTNVEDARHDRIDSVLRMPMRHQLCTAWRLNPDYVRAGLGGMADDDGKAHRWWKRRKRLPVDVFRQDRSENRLAWLMLAGHGSHRFFVSCIIQSANSHTLLIGGLSAWGDLVLPPW